MIRSTIALALLLATPAVADEKADAEFAKLYAEAWKDPAKADFAKLKAAFVETSKYHPYSMEKDERAAVKKALDDNDPAAAIKAMDAVIDKKPLNIDHHAFAAFLCEKYDQKDKAAKHKGMTEGLMKSMLEGHDGKSFEGAIPVLEIGEEYWLLGVMKTKSKGQALMMNEGHRYDVHTIDDPETGKERPIYFNIDAPQSALSRMLKIKIKK